MHGRPGRHAHFDISRLTGACRCAAGACDCAEAGKIARQKIAAADGIAKRDRPEIPYFGRKEIIPAPLFEPAAMAGPKRALSWTDKARQESGERVTPRRQAPIAIFARPRWTGRCAAPVACKA